MNTLNNSPFGSHRTAPIIQYETLPASQYLQERLQERRSKSTRTKRSRQSDVGPRRGRDDDIFLAEAEDSRHVNARMYDSSPLGPAVKDGSQVGGNSRARKAVGAKELDEQMDRLTKQNFALKLELDHRRERTAKLEEQLNAMRMQVERAEKLEDEHSELLKINSQLVEELEKRDKAVEEAMDIICDLEEKVEVLEEESGATRPSTAQADSGYASTETHEAAPASSPPRLNIQAKTSSRKCPPAASAASAKLHEVVQSKTPGRPNRVPSFISQKKPSTQALRSVYLDSAQELHPVKSFNSLLTRHDSKSEEDDVLNSPRLSVLSESSFPSLYSPKKKFSPERYAWEAVEEDQDDRQTPVDHYRQSSIHRVSQWIAERDDVDTPSKSKRISSSMSSDVTERGLSPPPMNSQQDHYQSLNDALSHATKKSPELLRPTAYSKPSFQYLVGHSKPDAKTNPRTPTFGGPMFGEPLLPPTPESASTRMLRASRSSIAGDRSLLDTTPAVVKGYATLEPGVRTAPKQFRSSVELHNAYSSNLLHRTAAESDHDALDLEESSSSDDDVDDARPSTIRDFGFSYNDYPDGASIINGTPSRFLKHDKAPAANMFFSPDESPEGLRSGPRRRQSSSEVQMSVRKPSLSRAETSPIFSGTSGRFSNGGQIAPTESSLSPKSEHSMQSRHSSNRTVINTQARDGDNFPEMMRSQSRLLSRSPSKGRSSASPAPSLMQRTQKMFRRLSNSQADGPTSPTLLPTLTSTPSSAYVNTISRDSRRPSTSQGMNLPVENGRMSSQTNHTSSSTRQSSTEGRRPSLQARTKTEPSFAEQRSISIAPVGKGEKDGRKNPFKRTSSVKKTPGAVQKESTVHGKDGGLPGSGRRSSIREAVTGGRKAWR